MLSRPADDVLQRDVQRVGERRGGERVVDVVEAGQGQRDVGLASGGVQREARGPHAFQPHVGREDTVGAGRAWPQVGQR